MTLDKYLSEVRARATHEDIPILLEVIAILRETSMGAYAELKAEEKIKDLLQDRLDERFFFY